MGAVIDAGSFATQKEAIEEARADATPRCSSAAATTTARATSSQPTVIETRDPNFRLLRDELFGPVVTAYVYPENEYEQTLELVDRTAPYGLTGAVFARDRSAIELAATSSSTRPATSTSTTSRRARSSASSPSAAPGPPGRTTRPARCGT